MREVLRILDRDAEAGEEAVVAEIVDRRLVGVEVERGDLGASLALSPSVAFAHWPISSPALKLSVAKLASAAVGGSSGVSSVMTRMPASRAFLTVGTIAVEVARHQQDALGAGGHQLLDRRDLAVVVAVRLAGVGLRRQAELLGLRLEAFLHLDEERDWCWSW